MSERLALRHLDGKPQPRPFAGRFRDLRRGLGAALLVLFLATAWLDWDGRQAVWWDLPRRQFHIFGATFWPQDFVLLSALLIIAAFSLFLVTVFAGRVWCGYACPQSVWTWLFLWCERVTEGDRRRRPAHPDGAGRLLRKGAKHALWLAIGLVTGVTFVGYFTPIRQLLPDLLHGDAGGWASFWIGFFTLATYLNAGWLREQVCVHMCPYARFQSVMFDADTLIVSYDARRGEPRGARRKGDDPGALGLGDCTGCTLCVQACPTGIDIRDGLQIACIGCAACIDACDTVMDKLGYPRGLVRYTTENALAGQPTRLWRPRLLGYGGVLLAVLGAFAWAVASRPLVQLDVIKDRLLYRETAEGRIENVYTLRIVNKTPRDQHLVLDADGLDGLRYQGRREVLVPAGALYSLPVELSADAATLAPGGHAVHFHLHSPDGRLRADTDSRFNGPAH